MSRRIHITGASGAGTTTIGEYLGDALKWAHFDTDDDYWLPTDPPFRMKREMPERLLQTTLDGNDDWVLSGSLDSWGDPLIPLFTTVVFLEVPTEIRLRRLRERDTIRFGSRAIQPGGSLHDHHREFLDWAVAYESGDFAGRSRPRHKTWLARLGCLVIVARGDSRPEELTSEILAQLPE